MHIEHIALRTNNLEKMKAFYEKHFQAVAGGKYQNTIKQYQSYFMSFPTGALLELMRVPMVHDDKHIEGKLLFGYSHIAFACGSEQSVNDLTERIHHDGYQVVDGPRLTGDGYYESVVLDPDGNRVELTA